MKTSLLQGLSFAGFCWLAISAVTTASAQAPCPPRSQCSTGYCRTGCHQCGYGCLGGQDDCCLHAVKKWALCCNYYILPPDYGWNAPTKVPVERKGVTYYRYWPETWYGTGTPNPGEYRTYPTAANPTDTAQLGYTYQQVPCWKPDPHRLPPVPVPSQWHVREAHRSHHGQYHSYYTPINYYQPAASSYFIEPLRPTAPYPVLPKSDSIPPAPEPAVAPRPLEPAPAEPAPAADPVPPAPADADPVPPAPADADPVPPAPAVPAADEFPAKNAAWSAPVRRMEAPSVKPRPTPQPRVPRNDRLAHSSRRVEPASTPLPRDLRQAERPDVEQGQHYLYQRKLSDRLVR